MNWIDACYLCGLVLWLPSLIRCKVLERHHDRLLKQVGLFSEDCCKVEKLKILTEAITVLRLLERERVIFCASTVVVTAIGLAWWVLT